MPWTDRWWDWPSSPDPSFPSRTRHTHLKTEGLSTEDVESSRKWFWLMVPLWVSTVTTGKPICSVQRSMMLLMLSGSWTLFSSTACGVAALLVTRGTGCTGLGQPCDPHAACGTPSHQAALQSQGWGCCRSTSPLLPFADGPRGQRRWCCCRRRCGGRTVGEHQERQVSKGKSGVWYTPGAPGKVSTMGCPPCTGLAAPQYQQHLTCSPFLKMSSLRKLDSIRSTDAPCRDSRSEEPGTPQSPSPPQGPPCTPCCKRCCQRLH